MMLRLKTIRNLLLASALILCANQSLAEDLLLVTHSDSNISISRDHLKRLFFGKISSLPNGRKVTAVVFTKNELQFQQFTKKYLGRTSQQIRSFWAKQLFTGKGTLPVQVKSMQEMIELVSSSDEYIGYIPADALQAPLQVLDMNSR